MIIGTSPLPKEGGIVYKTKATPEAYARTMQFRRAVRYFWRNKEKLTAQYPTSGLPSARTASLIRRPPARSCTNSCAPPACPATSPSSSSSTPNRRY